MKGSMAMQDTITTPELARRLKLPLDQATAEATHLRATASSVMVNRTHRVIRERAKTMQARRSFVRSLAVPLAIFSGILIVLCTAVWTVLDQYELSPTGMPDASQQMFVLLIWCLPLSAVLLALVLFGRSRSRTGNELDGGCAMTLPWGLRGSDRGPDHARQNGTENDDLAMIPWWSVALAVLSFAGMQFLFHGVLPHHKHEMFPMRLLMGYSWGTLVASYVLLVGYVSRDVKRRNMSAGLWLLIVIMMPGGIGAVVYFLLRQPLLSRCPHCSTEISSSYHFCPQCQFQVAPVCGQCFRGVEITDVYCKQCGHDLEQDNVPARLRAFRE